MTTEAETGMMELQNEKPQPAGDPQKLGNSRKINDLNPDSPTHGKLLTVKSQFPHL